MSVIQFNSIADLYRVDAIFEIDLEAGPRFVATGERADEYPGATSAAQRVPLLTKYAVYDARVIDVLQLRPGADPIAADTDLRVAFNVLNPDLSPGEVSNVEDLRGSDFPTATELPRQRSRILVFATSTILGTAGSGFEAVAFATAAGTADTLLIAFAPGSVRGMTISRTDLSSESVAEQFSRPRDR